MTTFETIVSYLRAAIPEFTNQSEAAIDKKIASSLAPVIDNTITELSNTVTVIEDIIGQQRYGKSEYYTQKALEFQTGVNLVLDADLNYVYETVDATKQIIKQAAFEIASSGNNQVLSLKVATLDPNTNKLIALTAGQKTEFDNYFNLFEIPGLPIQKISSDANVFNFTATITYYATYDYNVLLENITNALTSFRDSYTFNGVLYVNDLEDYLKQNVPGIRNASLSNTTITDSLGVPTAFTNFIKLSSGYFDYNPAVSPSLFVYVTV